MAESQLPGHRVGLFGFEACASPQLPQAGRGSFLRKREGLSKKKGEVIQPRAPWGLSEPERASQEG